jgi:hypothetical protein
MSTAQVQWKPDTKDPGTCFALVGGKEVGWVSDDDEAGVMWWVRGPHRILTRADHDERVRRRRFGSSVAAVASNPARSKTRFGSVFGKAGHATAAKRAAEAALSSLYREAA